jgi:hypothetical protein
MNAVCEVPALELVLHVAEDVAGDQALELDAVQTHELISRPTDVLDGAQDAGFGPCQRDKGRHLILLRSRGVRDSSI